MSNDKLTTDKPKRVSPWPNGSDNDSGLYVVVKVGYARSGQSSGDIDFAINSAADTDMSPGRRKEMVEVLECLVRHFSGPATLS